MVSAAGDGEKKWMLLNNHMSVRCLAVLLGMGTERLLGASQGKLDMRFRCFGSVPWLALLADVPGNFLSN